jgi:hypothetical protein
MTHEVLSYDDVSLHTKPNLFFKDGLPTQDTENKIHHEESSDDDHGDEVRPLPRAPHRVFNLTIITK